MKKVDVFYYQPAEDKLQSETGLSIGGEKRSIGKGIFGINVSNLFQKEAGYTLFSQAPVFDSDTKKLVGFLVGSAGKGKYSVTSISQDFYENFASMAKN